jgi:hypothetical protein
LSVELIEKVFVAQAETFIKFWLTWRVGLCDMFLGKKGCLITVIKMSFLEKAKKKAEEDAKKAADAAKNAGEKGAQGAKKAGEKVKEAGEKAKEKIE